MDVTRRIRKVEVRCNAAAKAAGTPQFDRLRAQAVTAFIRLHADISLRTVDVRAWEKRLAALGRLARPLFLKSGF